MFRNLGWAWFPIGLIASMFLVFLVNGYMVYTALASFPGEAGADGFDLSNNYDKVLGTVARQQKLGWTVETGLDHANHPALRLAGAAGSPLPPAVIEARAERPVGPAEATPLTFHQAEPTRYVTDRSLPRGQWDLVLTVRAAGQTLTTTSRLIVQ